MTDPGRSPASVFLERFRGKARAERVPLAGALELTQRCNLRCVHCYLGSLRGPRAAETGAGPSGGPSGPAGPIGPRASARELGTARMLALLDEVVEEGCLQLLFTGGEPLLRRDFREIYRHACERGLLISVFTNATLVDEALCSLFRELPPAVVDVTLYGATAATYEAVTQVAGSYARCLAGIDRLLENGVRLGLKTVVLNSNVHEFEAVRAMAESRGVPFRYDAAVSAALDGDVAPTTYRLTEREAIDLELADEVRVSEWRRRRTAAAGGSVPRRLYGCGAGVSSFFVDAVGTLYPCLMARSVSYDVRYGDFARGWREAIPQLHDRGPGRAAGCAVCEARSVCDLCPGFAALETGAEDGRSDYLCRIGRARLEAIAV